MWMPNIQRTALLTSAAVTVVAVSPVQAADNYAFGRCVISRPDSGTEIRPTYAADSYLTTYHRNDPRYQGFSFDRDDAKVTLVKAPSHGKVVLEEEEQWSGSADYHYWPEAGYVGKDRFVMQVERNGIKVRIQYLIDGLDEVEPSTGICNPETWKISSFFYTPALDNTALQALLDATGINNSG